MSQSASRKSPRGRPVDVSARAAKTAQILAAARGCFIEKGFHAASTADISAAAGISVANLYQYFPSKEDLVVAMTEEDLKSDLAFVSSIRASADFITGVEDCLGSYLAGEGAAEELRLRTEILAEAGRNARVRKALLEADTKVAESLESAVRQARKGGQIDSRLDPRATARLMLCLFDGLAARATVESVDLESLISDTLKLLRSLLKRKSS